MCAGKPNAGSSGSSERLNRSKPFACNRPARYRRQNAMRSAMIGPFAAAGRTFWWTIVCGSAWRLQCSVPPHSRLPGAGVPDRRKHQPGGRGWVGGLVCLQPAPRRRPAPRRMRFRPPQPPRRHPQAKLLRTRLFPALQCRQRPSRMDLTRPATLLHRPVNKSRFCSTPSFNESRGRAAATVAPAQRRAPGVAFSRTCSKQRACITSLTATACCTPKPWI
jgi:hypothetical protein